MLFSPRRKSPWYKLGAPPQTPPKGWRPLETLSFYFSKTKPTGFVLEKKKTGFHKDEVLWLGLGRSPNFRNDLFHLGQKLIEKESRGLLVFYPFSLLWAFVAFCKNWLYDRAVFSSKRVFRPVISIGNIVAGGTGKTPLTQLLASCFAQRNVAILSRGFGLQGALLDEPALLARRCPSARVYVGKDRRESAKRAVQEGAELLLLDDGFQHRRLFRDIDIVLVSAEKPFSNRRYLPCGYLRDQPKRLNEADLVCVNPIYSEEQLSKWQKTFGVLTPLVGVHLAVSRLVPDMSLYQVPVAFFCGIARPRSFRKVVIDLGAVIVSEWILGDHQGVSAQKLQEFSCYAKSLGAKVLVCTEKDAVKLPDSLKLSLPLVYPEMSMQMAAGLENWQNIVDKIGEKIDNYRIYGK
ncbi:MAG: tetraacyldisaccharide 4'-kinase [Chlamydiales bacterium]|nr:tetraacyldisaccharide 4'-kinase [Chlamydiales bacterium]